MLNILEYLAAEGYLSLSLKTEPMIQNRQRLMMWGVYLGIVHLFAGALLYLAGPKYMTTWWVGLLMLVVFVTLHFVFAFKYRKEIGGFMSYWQAFFASCTMGIIAGLMGTVLNLIIVGFIDPQLPEKMYQATVDNTIEMMEQFDAPQDKIDEVIEEMEESRSESNYSIGGQLKGIIWQFIGSAIFGFIVAAFLRKNPPPFEQTGTDQLQGS